MNFCNVQTRVLLFLSGVLIILIIQCITSQLDHESQAGERVLRNYNKKITQVDYLFTTTIYKCLSLVFYCFPDISGNRV